MMMMSYKLTRLFVHSQPANCKKREKCFHCKDGADADVVDAVVVVVDVDVVVVVVVVVADNS